MPTNAIRKSKSDLIHLKFMLKKQMTNQITIMSYKDLDIQGQICKRTKSHTLSDYITLTPAIRSPKSIEIARIDKTGNLRNFAGTICL